MCFLLGAEPRAQDVALPTLPEAESGPLQEKWRCWDPKHGLASL